MTPADQEHRIHLAGTRAMVAEAARIRAEFCASRGLPPSSACRVPELGCEGGDEFFRRNFQTGINLILEDEPSECESEGGET
jgi:hypothetical protein